jgi:hypothetical protein
VCCICTAIYMKSLVPRTTAAKSETQPWHSFALLFLRLRLQKNDVPFSSSRHIWTCQNYTSLSEGLIMTLLRKKNDNKLIEIDKSTELRFCYFLKYLRSKGFIFCF